MIFDKVYTYDELIKIEKLAQTIWLAHYTPIIGERQVNYMLSKFQSANYMLQQIEKENYSYFIIKINDQLAGYIALQIDNSSIFASKVYLIASCCGKGYGKKIFNFIEEFALNMQCKHLWLTVNINNSLAIKAYEKYGLKVTRKQQTDIGSGYIMDDFIMEKTLI